MLNARAGLIQLKGTSSSGFCLVQRAAGVLHFEHGALMEYERIVRHGFLHAVIEQAAYFDAGKDLRNSAPSNETSLLEGTA
jgi:hypothetical protein